MENGRRRTMSCPYLTQVTMAFCRAFPVKKLVPTDRVLTESACEGDCYASCPVFREATVRLGSVVRAVEQASQHPAPKEGGGS
jgi:hypothetical protein